MSSDWNFSNWPKNRGAFNGLGRSKAQTLDGIGIDYLKKRPRPGVLAEKKGERLYVTVEQPSQVKLKFLAVGRAGADPRHPNMRIFGADSIGGPWTDRGPAPVIKNDGGLTSPNGGWRLRSNPPGYPAHWELLFDNSYAYGAQQMSALSARHMMGQLHAYGRGKALFAAYKATQYHAINVFLGMPTSEIVREDHLTKDGREFEVKQETRYARAARNTSTGNLGTDGTDAWYTSGTRYGPDGQFLFARAVIGYQGTRFPRCLCDDGEAVTAYSITHENEAQNVVLLGFSRIGPGWFVAVIGVHWHPDALPTTAASIEIRHSTDGGKTWQTIAEEKAPMFGPAFSVMPQISSNTGNNRFRGFTFHAAPLSATKAVVMASMPTTAAPTSYNEARIGVFDRQTGSIDLIEVLASTDAAAPERATNAAQCLRAIQPGLVAMGPGVAVFTSSPRLVGVSGFGFYYEPSRVRFIERGKPTELVDVGAMPFAPHRTGVPTAAGPATLVCPMYEDGAYRAYQGNLARDPLTQALSLEWVPRSVITMGAPPPEEINGMDYNAARYGVSELYGIDPVVNVLPEFTTLLPMRSDGNTTPGVPWASDSRIAAPE